MIVTVATPKTAFSASRNGSIETVTPSSLPRPYTTKSAVTGIQADQHPTINNARDSPVDSLVDDFSPSASEAEAEKNGPSMRGNHQLEIFNATRPRTFNEVHRNLLR